MENKLVIWTVKSNIDELQSDIKNELYKQYELTKNDFELTEKGFEFLFDDVTSGNIQIDFVKNGQFIRVEVLGDHASETIEVCNLVTDVINDTNSEASAII